MAGGKSGGVGEDDVGEVLADVALEFVGCGVADGDGEAKGGLVNALQSVWLLGWTQ